MAALVLSGCVAEAIDYTASTPSDCCYFWPDTGEVNACFVAFVPAGTCERLECDGLDYTTPLLCGPR